MSEKENVEELEKNPYLQPDNSAKGYIKKILFFCGIVFTSQVISNLILNYFNIK